LRHFRTDARRVVYAKRPFAGPSQVLSYLSRYTHRVAIGHSRILALDCDQGTVTFAYKDYRDDAQRKTMTLSLTEFLRRFCLHILPERFVKIRHYGLLGNHRRKEKIERARQLITEAAPERKSNAACEPNPQPTQAPSAPALVCPHCGSANLICIERRDPPSSASFDSS
jgi:hypothetical protein